MKVCVSVDDGCPEDLFLAEKLAKIGASAVFYVPKFNIEGRKTLTAEGILTLKDMGHEVGSHTYNHIYLDSLSTQAAYDEISAGNNYLSDILGQKVTKFCLPGGRFPRDLKILNCFGFESIRTVRNMNFNAKNELFVDPSYQFYPHTRSTIYINSLKQKSLNRLLNASKYLRTLNNRGVADHTKVLAEFTGCSTVHVWAHSWELTALDLTENFVEHVKGLHEKNYNS